ncbi:hypothetical protein ACIA5D_27150 [Actinoplanes sp. NPDC051513]|uniref:hypothetical protein n=1 Tax=Actinoplanes sp. NPDC051513 TaxID=3363908 RepID=UPI00378898D6
MNTPASERNRPGRSVPVLGQHGKGRVSRVRHGDPNPNVARVPGPRMCSRVRTNEVRRSPLRLLAVTISGDGLRDDPPVIMSATLPVEPALFRTHAGNLDAVRELLGETRNTSRQIEDQQAFGPLCASILTSLADRYDRYQEQLEYLEENLLLMVQSLHRVADGTTQLKHIVRRDDDVATTDGTPLVEGPSHSLHGLMDTVITRVRNREWVEPQLADAAPVAEFAAPVDELTAALRAGGLRYAMTCVGPLRRLLDELTGAPGVAASHAAIWHTVSADLQQLSVFLHQSLDQDLPRRDRLDIRSYRARMAYNIEALIGCAEIAEAMAVIVKAAGDLILLTRDIIRGIIGNLFADVIVWALDSSTVTTRPVLAVRLGTVAATTWRIDTYITACTDSITTLTRILDG